MEKTKLELLIEKYGTGSIPMTFRHIASATSLSPYMVKEVAEMTTMLEEALKEYVEEKERKKVLPKGTKALYHSDPEWGANHNR